MPTARRDDIDALRVLLFATLILYHCAMRYVADWSFHLKSSDQTTALQIPMLLVECWRMPLPFLKPAAGARGMIAASRATRAPRGSA
jgi:hypothetical protein